MNLHIYYRHYNTRSGITKRRPEWFSYQRCLNNLFETLSNSVDTKIYFTLVYDGTEEEYQSDFSSKLVASWFGRNQNLSISRVLITAGSDKSSGNKTVLMAVNNQLIADDDVIYLLENDYLHLEGWVDAVRLLFYSQISWHYVSLYDHLDKYNYHERFHKRYKRLKSFINVTKFNHWRSAPSTCGSFLVRAKTLREDQFYVIRFKDRKLMPILKILKNRTLLSALPGLSTHCMEGLLSPTIDWRKIAENNPF